MQDPKTNVSELCSELKISRNTLYKYVGPQGELRKHGKRGFDKVVAHITGLQGLV